MILLPYPGLQNDEALFGSLIYEPRTTEYFVQIFGHRIPLMTISYLGGLKSLLYAGIFQLWPPSLSSVRIPVVVFGAASVWLFAVLLRQALGSRASWIGGLLLATDTTFLLTTTFDWGPVALQHLLLLGGIGLLWNYNRGRKARDLALGFFLFGLGMWDKAIFVWVLSGAALASLILLREQVAQLFSWRRLCLALAAFLVGAAPLVVFNFRYRGLTFRNARYDTADLWGKARLLRASLDGSSLFGYLTREQDGHSRLQAPNTLEAASLALSELAGRPRRNFMIAALLLSLASLILLPGTAELRAALFAVVAIGIAWPQMALNQGTGGSTHHVVLLWPFPHLLLAAALAGASRRLARYGRWLAVALAASLAGSNLLVSNEYLAQFVRHGAGPAWTEAIHSLAARLGASPGSSIVVADWGILDTLRLLGQGRFRLYQAIDIAAAPVPGPEDQRTLRWLLSLPDPIFVGHVPGEEAIAGSGRQLASHASILGYQKQLCYTVADRHGRAVFEVYRFVPTSAPSPP